MSSNERWSNAAQHADGFYSKHLVRIHCFYYKLLSQKKRGRETNSRLSPWPSRHVADTSHYHAHAGLHACLVMKRTGISVRTETGRVDGLRLCRPIPTALSALELHPQPGPILTSRFRSCNPSQTMAAMATCASPRHPTGDFSAGCAYCTLWMYQRINTYRLLPMAKGGKYCICKVQRMLLTTLWVRWSSEVGRHGRIFQRRHHCFPNRQCRCGSGFPRTE